MRIITGKNNKTSLAQSKKKVVATFNRQGIAQFSGFDFTVEEGLALSKRSHTEIPGLLTDSELEKLKG